jgi:hypothetical protein
LLVAGVTLAGPISRQIDERGAMVLLPPAFVLFGGTYMHIAQMCVAIPIVLLLLAKAARQYRTGLAIALTALAIPWLGLVGSPLSAILASVVAAVCLRPGIRRERITLAAMAAVAFFLIGVTVWAASLHHAPGAIADAAARTHVSASAAWAQTVANVHSPGDAVYWVVKLPTWLALLVLLATVSAMALERFRRTLPAVERSSRYAGTTKALPSDTFTKHPA